MAMHPITKGVLEHCKASGLAESFSCERCQEDLDAETLTWLELNSHTGRYAKVGTVPAGESQGCFPFGKACARSVLRAKGALTRMHTA